ncbi:PREDICTED: uncharacterized protein LOC105152878 [Acromyrmex echinatior]|uniref:uncharacterized protein LOC105152878 n=1 Tax=Acromyrmex echinatior TaxID=103372 RepID=UPI000580C53C|nr:PREDICTED: uncharacterized protein LOC105152878 [Acromyrmex echinatior]
MHLRNILEEASCQQKIPKSPALSVIESRDSGRRVKDYSCRHQKSDDANDEAMCPHIDANWTDYEEDSLVLKTGAEGEKTREAEVAMPGQKVSCRNGVHEVTNVSSRPRETRRGGRGEDVQRG